MATRKRSMSNDSDIHALHKEWDEVSCPICMDHPHNAVLLLCSSHEKGCRSYICDTSYRHSNCLDRYRKLRADNKNSLLPPSLVPANQHNSVNTSDRNLGLRNTGVLTEVHGNHNLNEGDTVASVRLPGGAGENGIQEADRHLEIQEGIFETGDSDSLWGMVDLEENSAESLSESGLNFRCPLCRGTVLGWEVVEEARKYLNLKSRSCSRESCSFFGNYRELRGHARRVHPTARPADIDPSRLQAWQQLEHQREYGDMVSAIRSAMPGAIVLGDYVIENGDRLPGDRERGSGEVNGPPAAFFVFQMIGSMDPLAEPRGGRSRTWTRHRRSTAALSRRRFLWGENLLGLQDDEDEDEDDDFDLNILSDMGEDASPMPRRRRRLTQSRSDEDQS
ncbi:hypothetical protein F0562_002335 [Nyssa sinensis]|uniref:Uncharacterized protein n=1 Tax=Nyssa sinensis TaxID=561372 RepID=A0A5J5CAI5_9ASTE|nr:hypothetical protein F0562_002335 [Nyssa sinensis]